jgi:hypothetical protein
LQAVFRPGNLDRPVHIAPYAGDSIVETPIPTYAVICWHLGCVDNRDLLNERMAGGLRGWGNADPKIICREGGSTVEKSPPCGRCGASNTLVYAPRLHNAHQKYTQSSNHARIPSNMARNFDTMDCTSSIDINITFLTHQ